MKIIMLKNVWNWWSNSKFQCFEFAQATFKIVDEDENRQMNFRNPNGCTQTVIKTVSNLEPVQQARTGE